MKIALPLTACGLLAFAAVILALNYLEEDLYPYALTAPPSDPLNAPDPWGLPKTLPHPCPDCDGAICEHEVVLNQCEVVISVIDRDGWYRLFWSEDDIHYYDDPVYFMEALKNPSTLGYIGIFTIEGECKPAGHDHACGREHVKSFRIVYQLTESPERLQEKEPPPDAPFPAPPLYRWMSYPRVRDGKEIQIDYAWELQTLEVSPGPCNCN